MRDKLVGKPPITGELLRGSLLGRTVRYTKGCPKCVHVLADGEIVAAVYEALAKRRPKSRSRGRRGTPAAVVLRLLVLKHIRCRRTEEKAAGETASQKAPEQSKRSCAVMADALTADVIVKCAKLFRAVLAVAVATTELVVRRRYHYPVPTARAVGHPRAVIVACRTGIET